MRETPAEQQKRKAVQDAIKVLKQNATLFASAQVEMMSGMDALNASYSPLPRAQSKERMEYALRGFDVRAEAHLKLIFNLEQQEAFSTLLQFLFVDMAWADYTSLPMFAIQAADPQMGPVHTRVREWIKRSFERLVSLGKDKPKERAGIPSKARTFREPKPDLLKNPDATLKRRSAAEAIGVSERTLDRMVEDETLTPVYRGSQKRFKTKDLRNVLQQKEPRQRVDKSRHARPSIDSPFSALDLFWSWKRGRYAAETTIGSPLRSCHRRGGPKHEGPELQITVAGCLDTSPW
jgi:hypothetical protein